MEVIPLGRICGKMKYALVDDDSIKDGYKYQVKLEIDQNGSGARIMAWAFNRIQCKTLGVYLHELIWSLHGGSISPRCAVVHKNGLTMDNRLSNLAVICTDTEIREEIKQWNRDPHVQQTRKEYWDIIEQVSNSPSMFQFSFRSSSNRFYGANGDNACAEESDTVFYECHNPPCCRMEKFLCQFNVCGQCGVVRYCSVRCQELNWLAHKRFCQPIEKSPLENFIDR